MVVLTDGVSILTRPWGRVQPADYVVADLQSGVSILTRPWGRVQLVAGSTCAPYSSRFNPHPPVGAGATAEPDSQPLPYEVSILTRPWGRVQRLKAACKCSRLRVSILTRPWGRVQPRYDWRGYHGGGGWFWVSILTRPWGRVQPDMPILAGKRPVVSILTRPWGRVQPCLLHTRRLINHGSFNPHPPVGAGATRLPQQRHAPDPRFNPHPPVGAGATPLPTPSPKSTSKFQSSPARGGGCNAMRIGAW